MTMKILFAALISLAITGCASHTVYEASVGTNVTQSMPWSGGQDGGFYGPKDVVRFAVRQESDSGRFFVEYAHTSHLSAGWPVNDHAESWLDTVSVGVRFDSRRW